MENDTAPLDVKQSRLYNGVDHQIKPEIWHRKLIGNGFAEKKWHCLNHFENRRDFVRWRNRATRSFVKLRQESENEEDMLDVLKKSPILPNDSSLLYKPHNISPLSEDTVNVSNSNHTSKNEEKNGAMSSNKRCYDRSYNCPTFLSTPRKSLQFTTKKLTIDSSISFLYCVLVCLLLGSQFTAADVEVNKNSGVGRVWQEEGNGRLAVRNVEDRSYGAFNSPFTLPTDNRSQLTSHKQVKRMREALHKTKANLDRRAFERSREMLKKRRRNLRRKRLFQALTSSKLTWTNEARSHNPSMIPKDFLPSESNDRKLRHAEAQYKGKKGQVSDLIDIPSSERDTQSFLSLHRKRSILSNVSSPNGNVRHVASLPWHQNVFLTLVTGSPLDIPVVNLASAYKVRRLTWIHRQDGRSLPKSNSISQKGLTKVGSGVSFAGQNLIRHKKSHQGVVLGKEVLNNKESLQDNIVRQHLHSEENFSAISDNPVSQIMSESISVQDRHTSSEPIRENESTLDLSKKIEELLTHNKGKVRAAFVRNTRGSRKLLRNIRSTSHDYDSESQMVAGFTNGQEQRALTENFYDDQNIREASERKMTEYLSVSPKSSYRQDPVNLSDQDMGNGSGVGSSDVAINTSSIDSGKHRGEAEPSERLILLTLPNAMTSQVRDDTYMKESVADFSSKLLVQDESIGGLQKETTAETENKTITRGDTRQNNSSEHTSIKLSKTIPITYNNISSHTSFSFTKIDATDDRNEEYSIKLLNADASKRTNMNDITKNVAYHSSHPHRHENKYTSIDDDFEEFLPSDFMDDDASHVSVLSSEYDAGMKSRATRSFKGKSRSSDFRSTKNGRKFSSSKNNRNRGRDNYNSGTNITDNCGLGYYSCNDRTCVLADRFCNGDSDCPNGEDEPPHCTRE